MKTSRLCFRTAIRGARNPGRATTAVADVVGGVRRQHVAAQHVDERAEAEHAVRREVEAVPAGVESDQRERTLAVK